ncbi:unnamed protein product [Caenorhabditis sp. 36 PRJEB53466]|nr:unnamed protein product [Caenorhabditis sp. 36 PRJEB53466]
MNSCCENTIKSRSRYHHSELCSKLNYVYTSRQCDEYLNYLEELRIIIFGKSHRFSNMSPGVTSTTEHSIRCVIDYHQKLKLGCQKEKSVDNTCLEQEFSEDYCEYLEVEGLADVVDEEFAVNEEFATVLEESESVFEEVDDFTEVLEEYAISQEDVSSIVEKVKEERDEIPDTVPFVRFLPIVFKSPFSSKPHKRITDETFTGMPIPSYTSVSEWVSGTVVDEYVSGIELDENINHKSFRETANEELSTITSELTDPLLDNNLQPVPIVSNSAGEGEYIVFPSDISNSAVTDFIDDHVDLASNAPEEIIQSEDLQDFVLDTSSARDTHMHDEVDDKNEESTKEAVCNQEKETECEGSGADDFQNKNDTSFDENGELFETGSNESAVSQNHETGSVSNPSNDDIIESISLYDSEDRLVDEWHIGTSERKWRRSSTLKSEHELNDTVVEQQAEVHFLPSVSGGDTRAVLPQTQESWDESEQVPAMSSLFDQEEEEGDQAVLSSLESNCHEQRHDNSLEEVLSEKVQENCCMSKKDEEGEELFDTLSVDSSQDTFESKDALESSSHLEDQMEYSIVSAMVETNETDSNKNVSIVSCYEREHLFTDEEGKYQIVEEDSETECEERVSDYVQTLETQNLPTPSTKNHSLDLVGNSSETRSSAVVMSIKDPMDLLNDNSFVRVYSPVPVIHSPVEEVEKALINSTGFTVDEHIVRGEDTLSEGRERSDTSNEDVEFVNKQDSVEEETVDYFPVKAVENPLTNSTEFTDELETPPVVTDCTLLSPNLESYLESSKKHDTVHSFKTSAENELASETLPAMLVSTNCLEQDHDNALEKVQLEVAREVHVTDFSSADQENDFLKSAPFSELLNQSGEEENEDDIEVESKPSVEREQSDTTNKDAEYVNEKDEVEEDAPDTFPQVAEDLNLALLESTTDQNIIEDVVVAEDQHATSLSETSMVEVCVENQHLENLSDPTNQKEEEEGKEEIVEMDSKRIEVDSSDIPSANSHDDEIDEAASFKEEKEKEEESEEGNCADIRSSPDGLLEVVNTDGDKTDDIRYGEEVEVEMASQTVCNDKISTLLDEMLNEVTEKDEEISLDKRASSNNKKGGSGDLKTVENYHNIASTMAEDFKDVSASTQSVSFPVDSRILCDDSSTHIVCPVQHKEIAPHSFEGAGSNIESKGEISLSSVTDSSPDETAGRIVISVLSDVRNETEDKGTCESDVASIGREVEEESVNMDIEASELTSDVIEVAEQLGENIMESCRNSDDDNSADWIPINFDTEIESALSNQIEVEQINGGLSPPSFLRTISIEPPGSLEIHSVCDLEEYYATDLSPILEVENEEEYEDADSDDDGEDEREEDDKPMNGRDESNHHSSGVFLEILPRASEELIEETSPFSSIHVEELSPIVELPLISNPIDFNPKELILENRNSDRDDSCNSAMEECQVSRLSESVSNVESFVVHLEEQQLSGNFDINQNHDEVVNPIAAISSNEKDILLETSSDQTGENSNILSVIPHDEFGDLLLHNQNFEPCSQQEADDSESAGDFSPTATSAVLHDHSFDEPTADESVTHNPSRMTVDEESSAQRDSSSPSEHMECDESTSSFTCTLLPYAARKQSESEMIRVEDTDTFHGATYGGTLTSNSCELQAESSLCSVCADENEHVPTEPSPNLPNETSSTENSFNRSEHSETSSVLEEVSYFLSTVCVAAMVFTSPSDSSNTLFNADIIEDASKYFSSQPKTDDDDNTI